MRRTSPQPNDILTALPWTFTDRQNQVKALIDEAPEGSTVVIGYGGAVGGGKTYLEAALAAELALDNPGVEVLVGRQDFIDLKDTTLKQFDSLTRQLPNRRKYDSAPVWRELSRSPAAPASRVTFRGLDDWESLMSTEYGAIFIEEAHEVPLDAVLGLLSRLRHPAVKKWILLICFNPLGNWPERWFMPDDNGETELPPAVKDLPSLRVHFVPALMADNPYLRPGYEAMLRAMYPEHLVQRLINGQRGGVQNAVYPHFNRVVHVVDMPDGLRFVDGAFGADYGRVHASAAVAVSVDQYGRRWVREAWEKPSEDHGRELISRVGLLRAQYGLRRGRADPNQDVLAGEIGASLAKSGAGSRQERINMTGRLFNLFPGGIVPSLHEELGKPRSYGPHLGADTPGLFLVKGAPGMDRLARQLEAYHYEHKRSDVKDEMVVARIDDDLVAALEYAIEELEQPRTDWAALQQPSRGVAAQKTRVWSSGV